MSRRAQKARLHPFALVAVFAAAMSVSSITIASQPADRIRQLAQSYDDLEFEAVIELSGQLISSSTLTDAQRVQVLRLEASAEAALGRDEDAGRTFEVLLDIDPTYTFPPNTSPRILSAVEPARARSQVRRERALAIELGPRWKRLKMQVNLPTHSVGGQDLTVPVSIEDPGHIVHTLVVHHRRRGARTYSTVTRRGVGPIILPGAITSSDEPYVLDVYVEALHQSGVTLRRSGGRDSPMSISLEAGRVPEPESIIEQWWFWGGIAIVVAAIPVVATQLVDVGPQDVVGQGRP